MLSRKLSCLFVLMFVLIGVVACTPNGAPSQIMREPAAESVIIPSADDPIVDEDATLSEPVNGYAESAVVDLAATQYVELVDGVMSLSDDERAMLSQNSFVVTDRYNWERFVESYAWIYKKDLPVLITTDSILHAVHQSYSDLLTAIEADYLIPRLEVVIALALDGVDNVPIDPSQAQMRDDVITYWQVAEALLQGKGVDEESRNEEKFVLNDVDAPDAVLDHLEKIYAADTYTTIDFLGSTRTIDYTQFQPRAHYNNYQQLRNYFRAMQWMAQTDARLIQHDPMTSEMIYNPSATSALLILHQSLNDEARQRLVEMDDVLRVLVGESDNMTLNDADRLFGDLGIEEAADLLTFSDDQMIDQLLNNDYGQQRIMGQIVGRHVGNESSDPIPKPLSFMLIGQRFVIDSYVMNNLVYDRLMVDGEPVERPFPSTFDVMYALGNDHALDHLTAELEQYNYEPYLATAREQVDSLDASFWNAPIYNQWLEMIRGLNEPTTGEAYPAAMRTAAWADKTVHTQLSSWAQLRHDHILYAKQSYATANMLCEFPSAYVEPYPDLYAALYEYAQTGHALLSSLSISSDLSERGLAYFQTVMDVAQQLETVSRKQLAGETITQDETLFLHSVIIKQDGEFVGCTAPEFDDIWTGWYRDMFFLDDDDAAIIADIHTNPTTDEGSSLYPPRVLHTATGAPVPIFMVVEIDGEPTLHVGPSFSYYEVTTAGDSLKAPERLTDELWRVRLDKQQDAPPAWTGSFRLPAEERPTDLIIEYDH